MIYPNAQARIDSHLQEGKQVGTVYHWTTSNGAAGIMDEDGLRPNFHDRRNRGNVISVTRDKNPNFWLYPDIYWRFVLDGDKIAQHYKIGPYSDSESGNTRWDRSPEAEEEILLPGGKKLGPLSKYVYKVEYHGPWDFHELKHFEDVFDEYGDDYDPNDDDSDEKPDDMNLFGSELEEAKNAVDAVRAARSRGIKLSRGKKRALR